jgi:hypothetical protein
MPEDGTRVSKPVVLDSSSVGNSVVLTGIK